MPSDQDRTMRPDLNFDPFVPGPWTSYERFLAYLHSANDRRARFGKGRVKTAEELEALARAASRDRQPSDPRVRYAFEEDGLAWFRRRADGRLVAHRSGRVELANQPGYDFDYRVAFEVAEVEGSPSFRCIAASPIARPDGPAVTVTRAYAGIGAMIQRAAGFLTWERVDGPEGVKRWREDLSELEQERYAREALLAAAPTRPRAKRTSAEVRDEAQRVAQLYQEWASHGPGGSYARWISQRMGWVGEAKRGEDRVRARMRRAESMGLDLPKAVSTRRRG